MSKIKKTDEEWKSLLTKEHYKKMKPNTYIINAARGNIIDEKDLNDALNENLIAGAAVDVFSKEPAKENVLFNNPKVILTPHIAASTTEASIAVAEMVANQMSDFFNENFKENVNYFEKKNKVKININSNDKLNFSEYLIEYKSKSKKVIEKVESLENFKKVIIEDKNLKTNKKSQKKIFRKKKYKKKFVAKKN